MRILKVGQKRARPATCESCETVFEFFISECDCHGGPDGEFVYSIKCPLCHAPYVFSDPEGKLASKCDYDH